MGTTGAYLSFDKLLSILLGLEDKLGLGDYLKHLSLIDGLVVGNVVLNSFIKELRLLGYSSEMPAQASDIPIVN